MAFLAREYAGFTQPWSAHVDPRNGEDAYTELVAEHLDAERVVLEAGCGHGVDALWLAGRAKRVIAFDGSPEFIELARASARTSGVRNVELLVADCSPKRNGGRARLPADDGSVDLLVSRRGPSSWIADARRVVRPGGTLIQLAFMPTPAPPWNEELPAEVRLQPEPKIMPGQVLRRLEEAGLTLYGSWIFDVPEVFTAAEELYKRLIWERRRADAPPYAEVRHSFEAVLARHGSRKGLALRQRRFLWKVEIG